MVDEKLVSYVKSCLKEGWSINKIKSNLYTAGWQKKDVEEAVSLAGGTPDKVPVQGNVPGPQGIQPTGGTNLKLYAGIIIIIIAVGAVTYYFVSNYLLFLAPVQPEPEPPQGAVCGDGNCTGQETYETCPGDCPAPLINQNVRLSISPATRIINSGEQAVFEVSISDIQNLYGFQFDFDYDENMLNFISAAEGTFLSKSGAESTFCIPPKASQGVVTVACTRLGAIGGVSGSGLLATITFNGVSSGTAQPVLKNVKLVDSNVNTINFRSLNG